MTDYTNLLRKLLSIVFLPLFLSVLSTRSAANVTVERSPQGAVVKIDKQLFTEYLVQSGTKPILWPIIGPTGKEMTRAYPMQRIPHEKQDHPHQRSLWFSHGLLNGIDFWTEKKGCGAIKHREFVKIESGKTGLIVTLNDWLSPDENFQCEDQRTLRFGGNADSRWIDFSITVKAADKPVIFGDTKEGTFGLRVPEVLSVDAKQGGQFVNSDGQINGDAWGKTASWVDYHGSIDGQTWGIAILNHPSSFRYPTCWHVREYGLFAANPFGLKEFTKDRKTDGTYTIPPGKSVTFRYLVIFHQGDEKSGKIAEAFTQYSQQDE